MIMRLLYGENKFPHQYLLLAVTLYMRQKRKYLDGSKHIDNNCVTMLLVDRALTYSLLVQCWYVFWGFNIQSSPVNCWRADDNVTY